MHIYALTDKGRELAGRINSKFPEASIIRHGDTFKLAVQSSFLARQPLVLICATGIAVRVLKDVIQHKLEDPPVLVLDEHGRFVIPLLSGHEGGANELASKMAKCIGAQAVITTANQYLAPVYTIGFGSERDCPFTVLDELMQKALSQASLTISDIKAFASIDIKADEVAMLAAAEHYDVPFYTYDKVALRQVESALSQKSDYVYKTVGVYGVAESAALVAAESFTRQPSELKLNKIKNSKATCAIARSYPLKLVD